MGKIVLAALVAGAFAALIVYFLLAAAHDEATQRLENRIVAAEKALTNFGDQLTDAKRRVADNDKRVMMAVTDAATAAVRAEDAKTAASAATAAATGRTTETADGSPLVTEKQAAAMVEKALAAREQGGLVLGVNGGERPTPASKKTLEEISADMRLTAYEEGRLRDTIRTMEEDMVKSIFGDRPLDDIARDIKAAKDDPDKQEELISTMLGGGLANIGKLATFEGRQKKKVEEILGAERAKEFLSKPRKPVIGIDLDKMFN